LAGSILEALLHDLLTRDQARIHLAMAAKYAPKLKSGAPKDIQSTARKDEWTLYDLIRVSDELGLVPKAWEASVQAVLREFRNYVHPRKELQMQDKITEGEAFQSLGALMRIHEYIEKNHP
jgi:hypothetical protein